MRAVLDTCILKLATLPSEDNAAALIFELVRSGLIELWGSPATLDEYADVLGDRPDFVAEIVEVCHVCHPLTELSVIRHEPDNRFLECALASGARTLRPRQLQRSARGDAGQVSDARRSSASRGQAGGVAEFWKRGAAGDVPQAK